MHRTLLPPLIRTSQSLPGGITVEPLPATSRLSPAELAQTYRAWRFGPGRTVSLIGETKR